ncbi:hypothetical protein Dsin_021792 [Dipteronia sinensis]|uniref:Reverse transcriptase domain-containing protein n=1 Tax=Dipteronia sinensis TaxID=43782 RepID=A0AAE0A177_9ROSI|nr:hypothetical protein Dsin_021792 [Dipteronia sinensis]
MKDFRPISCCNTLYKIIAKIVTNRIKPCLPDIISPSQSAFVAGRCIGDNILLVQELMRNYHKDASCSRLALKVDLMKDFDMVDWGFLLETLAAFHFPHNVIMWIKACLTTHKFSISINGELAGFFFEREAFAKGIPCPPTYLLLLWKFFQKFWPSALRTLIVSSFIGGVTRLSFPTFVLPMTLLCYAMALFHQHV